MSFGMAINKLGTLHDEGDVHYEDSDVLSVPVVNDALVVQNRVRLKNQQLKTG